MVGPETSGVAAAFATFNVMPDIALSPTQRATEPTAATEAARLEPGTRAGEYVVEHFLGAGAMGEVYAGKHPDIGKRVAIKVLKPALASSKEAAERFKREARVVNQIEHPNVIDVFAFGELADGRLYLVMDLVEGRTLREVVQDGPLAVDTALDILDQIADALDAAHAKGVVHRDLKPDNVMLAGPKVHVLDFGIAKLLATDADKPATLLTGQGAWVGTPGYMAPEQWSAEGASPASDRYALGVMAFELLAGKLPFQAQTLPQMMEQHFRAPVPALSARGAVPARATFDPVLARAMAKDPDKRYATAKALVTALREAAGKRRVLPGRTWWIPAALGAGVLGVAVVGVIAVRGGRSEREAANPSAATGFVQLEVRSNPARATVMRGDRMFGTTPAKLDARPGERIELAVRKPGYATTHEVLTASADRPVIDVVLVQVNGFEGTWVLPDGQLRAFARSGDEHVDVYKLESLKSERVFYRKFKLEDAPAGVRFASTELVVDQRAPTSPSCEIAVRVEYHYDPANDTLAVRPENVETGFQNGRCVVHDRQMPDPIALVRADATSDVRISRAPMGIPLDEPALRSRPEPQQDTKRQANPPPGKEPPARVQTKVPPTKRPPGKLPPGKGDIGAQNVDVPRQDSPAASEDQAAKPVPQAPAPQVKK